MVTAGAVNGAYWSKARRWWNPVTVALATMVVVIAIIGVRMTQILGDVAQQDREQCITDNLTADAWNAIIREQISEGKMPTSMTTYFPHQICH